jgi:hypothetical protein
MGLGDEIGFSKYHHILNRTKWSSLLAAKILLFMLLALVPSTNPLVLFADETLERRRGKKIKAKGYYRDAGNRLTNPSIRKRSTNAPLETTKEVYVTTDIRERQARVDTQGRGAVSKRTISESLVS